MEKNSGSKGVRPISFFVGLAIFVTLGVSSYIILCGTSRTGTHRLLKESDNPSDNITTLHSVIPAVKHISPPEAVKAIYMTSWVATVPGWRSQLLEFVDQSEVNALVLDIKDYSGKISFITGDPVLASMNVEEDRIKDIKEFILAAHQKNIYVIGRITVFQDPMYAKLFPSQAVKSRDGIVWRDRNGLNYIDPASTQFWNYIVRLAKASANLGFDEINFDYVRYPTDGNMANAVFPVSSPRFLKMDASPNLLVHNQVCSGNTTRARRMTKKEAVITDFFSHLHTQLAEINVPISADLFGMTMTSADDVNIGQYLESAAPYFDYICPMVYPSHYPRGFNGYSNPAEHPYDIVYFAMTHGVARLVAANQNPRKLRPWLQDFNLGAVYDAQKVRAQIKATYDSNLVGWQIWDPRNKYTRGAYLSGTNNNTAADSLSFKSTVNVSSKQ